MAELLAIEGAAPAGKQDGKATQRSEMAQSSNAASFQSDGEEGEDSETQDYICPECGENSVTTYIDRYSSYEYCTNCDWSEEDSDSPAMREPITRRDRVGRSDRYRQED